MCGLGVRHRVSKGASRLAWCEEFLDFTGVRIFPSSGGGSSAEGDALVVASILVGANFSSNDFNKVTHVIEVLGLNN